MALVINGTTVQNVNCNGTSLNSIFCNGSEVFHKDVELTIGTKYIIGNLGFYCAEKLANNIYAMQLCKKNSGSNINAHGYWPRYAASGASSTSNYEYQNVLDITKASSTTWDVSGLRTFYNTWKNIEADSTYKKGLYLIPYNKISSENLKGSTSTNYYYRGLYECAKSKTSFGTSRGGCWTGTVKGTGAAYFVDGSTNLGEGHIFSQPQGVDYVVAPAFNIDVTKINLSGTTITIKG